MVKKRRPTKRRVDRKVFRRTAVKSKKINLAPRVMRGGISL